MANAEQPERWYPPPIQVKWRNYFTPGADELKPVVEMVKLAKDAGFIDQRKAVEAVAQIFGIENIEAYLKTLETERTENDKRDLEKQAATLKVQADNAPAATQGAFGKKPNK